MAHQGSSPYPYLDNDGNPIMNYTMPYPLYPLGKTSVPPNNSHSHSPTISTPSGGVVDPASSGPEIDPRLIPPPTSAKPSYPFPCDKCSFGYSNADALQRHRSEYHGELTDIGRKRKENQRKAKEAPQESQFICHVGECGKVFSTGASLQRHKRDIHNPNSRYQELLKKVELSCPHCDKVLGSKNSLKDHLSRHHRGWETEQGEDGGGQQ
ncbi:hypothetical protein PG987_010797 [Apiospora arundinis]